MKFKPYLEEGGVPAWRLVGTIIHIVDMTGDGGNYGVFIGDEEYAYADTLDDAKAYALDLAGNKPAAPQ